jgi:membrane protease YdiL (CAAX protease family)
MNFKSLFVDDRNIVRSGWRVAIFTVSCAVLIVTGLMIALPVLMAVGVPIDATSPTMLIVQFSISLAAAIGLGWLWGRIFEGVPFSALGASFSGTWIRDLLLGLLIGMVSLAAAVLIAQIFGGFTFEFNQAGFGAILRTLASTLLLFVVGAAFEEAFFRGYMLQTLFRSRQTVAGIVITSVFFATIHKGNPGADPMSWVNTFLAGVWLAAAYWYSRNLWLAFGAHLAWNWFQGSVFGITVSGLETLAPDPLFRATAVGPVWATGGSYGIEASYACTVALIASTAVIFLLPGRSTAEPQLRSTES